MDVYTLFYYLFLAHVITSLINILYSFDFPETDRAFIIGTGVFPIISYLLVFNSIYKIIQRSFQTKGKCFLGHKFKMIYSSDIAAFGKKFGDRPGLEEEHECQKCGKKERVYFPTKEELIAKYGGYK